MSHIEIVQFARDMVRVKVLSKFGNRPERTAPDYIERAGVCFIYDSLCREYDWLVVYDEMPMKGDISMWEAEELACPRERTILITVEPPSIKLYPRCYTSQFGYVLTTHSPVALPHPNRIYGEGCLDWCAGITYEEAHAKHDFPKSKTIATVCSAKQQTHTLHSKRYALTKYIADRLPELDWYGWGVKQLDKKVDAQDDYRYSIAVENYVAPYHWTDKIADPLLSMCLTFYVGDPRLEEVFPAESFIRIPLENHEEAYQIIRKAIDENEYEKRLPAIREARRRLIEQNNMFNRVASLISQHQEKYGEKSQSGKTFILKGRHRLRRNVFNLISEGWGKIRYSLACACGK